jgi:tRNA pseudouridine55 synthase
MENPRADGLLLIDKPAGMTSHDVVAGARRALRVRRIGHTGTLDPFATGLLVLLVGRATRLARYVDSDPKVYNATIRFGAETDTDDITGTVVAEATPPTLLDLRRAIPGLTGKLQQLPPAYSAKQIGGVRSYAAARRGETLQLKPAEVTVESWEVASFDGRDLEATITCSSGTYIRALARDLGRAVSSAAHLAALRRERSGRFAVGEAIPMEQLGGILGRLRPMSDAVAHLPRVELSEEEARQVANGRAVPAAGEPGGLAALTLGAELVAIAELTADCWQPRLVLNAA